MTLVLLVLLTCTYESDWVPDSSHWTDIGCNTGDAMGTTAGTEDGEACITADSAAYDEAFLDALVYAECEEYYFEDAEPGCEGYVEDNHVACYAIAYEAAYDEASVGCP